MPAIERAAGTFATAHDERVRFGDTDAAGIVYYAAYLRWFEAGRAELLRAADLSYTRLAGDELILPVVEAWARYKAPAYYDDLLRIDSWVHEVRAASVLVAHQIWRGDVLIADGAARLTCMSREGHPRRLPAELRRLAGAS